MDPDEVESLAVGILSQNDTLGMNVVFRLSTLAKEVTRVSLEVGTEGIMGGQAVVPDVQGMWKVRFLKSSLVISSHYLHRICWTT